MFKKNNYSTGLIYLLLLIFSLIITFLHKKDINLTKSWLIFSLWLINFSLALLYLVSKIPRSLYSKISLIIKQDAYILTLVFILAFFTRFFLLSTFPYITLGDALRDTGLDALKIKQGLIKDFFDFGAYQGYGNFIPLISYFFIPFFKNSTLIYIFPSTIVGILSILATYLLARILGGRKIALISSLFLIGSFFHLHYSRTELLVITDSLLSPLIVLSTWSVFIFSEGYFLMGILSGLIFHFYAGTRSIIFISFMYVCLIKIIEIFKLLIKKDIYGFFLNLKKISLGLIIFFIGLIIALGPTINRFELGRNNNVVSNIGNTKIIFLDREFIEKNLKEKASWFLKTYEEAFMVYGFKSAKDNAFHFYYDSPLLNFPLNWFFLAGLFYLLLKKNSNRKELTNLLIFIVFLFPIPNQVATNMIGANHRLMSILPILSIFAAYGLVVFFEKFTMNYSKLIMGLFIFIYLSSQLFFYFFFRLSDLAFDEVGTKEYVFQKILEYIRNDSFYQDYFILNDEQFNYDAWHYREKIEFFTHPKKVELINKDTFFSQLSHQLTLNDKKTAFIFINHFPEIEQYKKIKHETTCLKRILPKYDCPTNFFGSYYFYILSI